MVVTVEVTMKTEVRILLKDPAIINLIIADLLKPQNRVLLFSDWWGQAELASLLYSPSTVIYGIFEKEGKPEPLGLVFFSNVAPFHDCSLWAIFFDAKDRNPEIARELYNSIKPDLLSRYHVHSISTKVIGDNPAYKEMLEAVGFERVGVYKRCIPNGGDYKDVTIYHHLMEDRAETDGEQLK
jgi:RimJ/RimL family protein N-acetyltransferase